MTPSRPLIGNHPHDTRGCEHVMSDQRGLSAIRERMRKCDAAQNEGRTAGNESDLLTQHLVERWG